MRELRRPTILHKASVYFAQAGSTAVQAMNAFVDPHRAVHGVEPICKVLRIAPSTHDLHAARG